MPALVRKRGSRPLALAMSLLAAAACPIHAQSGPRNLVAVAAPGHDPLFVDASSVQKRGNIVAFKYVLDVLAAPDERSSAREWRSNEIDASIDCAKRTVSVRRLTAFPGPKASGNATAVHSFTPSDTKPERITPGSTFAYLESHVCGK
jgi:hypothetical protein